MCLILVLVIAIVCSFFMLREKTTELFEQWDPLWVGKMSLNCYNETPDTCMNYSNCGFCINGGKKKCVPGDTQGPFFAGNCGRWMHTNYYDRHIFGEKVTTITPSWDEIYPDYELWSPSPISRATL